MLFRHVHTILGYTAFATFAILIKLNFINNSMRAVIFGAMIVEFPCQFAGILYIFCSQLLQNFLKLCKQYQKKLESKGSMIFHFSRYYILYN